jgi:hypothetical protein
MDDHFLKSGHGEQSVMTDGPSVITDKRRTDLTAAEHDVLRADRERWERMGAGGHLNDWLAYYPGLSIRRRLAMKLTFTNKPEGKGYVLAYNQLMRDDAFNTDDKTLMSQMGAVLWLRDNPEHDQILRDILETMTPGQRSRLNTPIAARQRVKTVLEARTRGTEKTLRQSPIAVLKGRVTEYECKIAHLEQKLAKAQDDTSLFDLKRDPPMTSFGS